MCAFWGQVDAAGCTRMKSTVLSSPFRQAGWGFASPKCFSTPEATRPSTSSLFARRFPRICSAEVALNVGPCLPSRAMVCAKTSCLHNGVARDQLLNLSCHNMMQEWVHEEVMLVSHVSQDRELTSQPASGEKSSVSLVSVTKKTCGPNTLSFSSLRSSLSRKPSGRSICKSFSNSPRSIASPASFNQNARLKSR